MSMSSEYRSIFDSEISTVANTLIYRYTPIDNTHTFQPLSHNCQQKCTGTCSENCHIELGRLMRKNLVFYSYGEDEILSKIKNGLFSDLEKASIYAYKNRLPDRDAKKDGLPGEVLLDLLVQIHAPNAYKLAVRTLFRQDDNNEIKGYDLTYFSMEDKQISIWLGQAKMGQKEYCKRGIHDDLIVKFQDDYLSRQVYFIAEKQAGITPEGKAITDAINKLNMLTIRESPHERARALIEHFQKHNITINIPCLLAYGEGSIYSDIASVQKCISDEMGKLQKYFTSKSYQFDGFSPNIIFFVFPLKNLDKLRGDRGFYNGLR